MEAMRQQVDQLRVEAHIRRQKVSEVSRDLIAYCEANKTGDTLISGPPDNHNPFQEKKSCNLL